jgi:hypothetical protein
MGAVLLFALIADAIILAASQFRSLPWAREVCEATINMCDHPVPLLVAGVILGGIFLVQR